MSRQAGRPKQQGSWQRGWWLVITIHALLLPLYGPLVDHHFAERLPYHSHLYLSGTGYHSHYYDLPHHSAQTHQHDLEQTPGVVSMPAHELASQNLLLLSLFLVALADETLRPLAATQFIGLVNSAFLPVKDTVLPVPERPPRPQLAPFTLT